MEYQIESELLQPTPRPIQPKLPPTAIGCMALFFTPFVVVGIYLAIDTIRTLGEVLHPDPQSPTHGATLGFIFQAVFALFWNGALIYMTTASIRKTRKDSLIVREGVPVPATILESKLESHNDTDQCIYRYSFVRRDGATIVGTQTVNRSGNANIEKGDTVTLLYLPDKSEQNALYRFCDYRAKGTVSTEYAHGTKTDPLPVTPIPAPSFSTPYRMEPELNQPIPRSIAPIPRGIQTASGCFILFMTPFVLIGLWQAYQSITITAVQGFGTTTEAIVESKAEGKRFLTEGKNGPSTHLYVTYRFQANGHTYRSQDDVYEKDYERIRPGDRLSIRYLFFAPSKLTLLVERSATADSDSIVQTLFWNGIVSLFILIPFSARVQGRRFIRRGIAVPATITSKTVDTNGNSDTCYLHFQYHVQGKASPLEGKQMLQKLQLEGISVGETLTLLYLPNAPDKYKFYRFSFYKARLS